MLKRIITTVLGLTCGIAFAGTMGPTCSPDNVTVPCPTRAWDLGVQALYLKPIYGARRSFEQTGNTTYRNLNNDWDWGFELEGSYHFSNGNDLDLNWTHFSDDNQFDGFTAPLTPQINVPYTLQFKTQFDQVNLVFGQHVDVGIVKNIRFYGGLQYANIHSDIERELQLSPQVRAALEVDGTHNYNRVDFNGVGPVIGIDYAYDFNNEFSLTADGNASILSGTARQHNGSIVAPTGLVLADNYASRRSIVPGVEAKLGVKYAHQMAQGTLNLSAGYQVINYFHALTLPLSGPGDSDFGLYGPYFGVNWLGNL